MLTSSSGAGKSSYPEIYANSVLLVDKPEGITSFGTVSGVRRLLGVKKAGHSGTLDKFAGGLLVICTGFATKLTRFFLESDKRYTGKIRFGIVTDTNDPEGNIIATGPVEGLKKTDVTGVLGKYRGEIAQRPPSYSSLKIKGRRASDLVREGREVSLDARKVIIKEINVLDFNPGDPSITLDIKCSKGTYIRSLARDIGNDLGCGAYLESLRRTESGRFSVNSAATMDEIRLYTEGAGVDKKFIIAPSDSLPDFSLIRVNERGRKRVLNGACPEYSDLVLNEYRMNSKYIIEDEKGDLLGIAEIDTENWNVKYLNIFNKSN